MNDGFENIGVKVVSQEEFVATAQSQLEVINNPKTKIPDSISAAGVILDAFTDIDNGKMKVEPPLSEEQKDALKDPATIAKSMGEKALEALEEAQAQSQKSRTPKKKKRVRGFGGAGKA